MRRRPAPATRPPPDRGGTARLRLNLATTRLGLSLHPVSQALQEHEEMRAHRARLHEMLAPPEHTVQMLGLVADLMPRLEAIRKYLDAGRKGGVDAL